MLSDILIGSDKLKKKKKKLIKFIFFFFFKNFLKFDIYLKNEKNELYT